MEILWLYIIPCIAVFALWFLSRKKHFEIVQAAASLSAALFSFYLAGIIIAKGPISANFFSGLIYLDALGAICLITITVIYFFASLYSIPYMEHEMEKGVVSLNKIKLYYLFLNIFFLAMLISVSTQNLGLIWIAIEATTLASAFLVGYYNYRSSLEAAWKYIIICSVGIAFALFGIVLMYFSTIQGVGHSKEGLNWLFLLSHAGSLNPSLVKISFLLVLVGFGTKAGLAPMHTWLPDAHSQAPSPVSALLSGVLLNTAMYGIARITVIVNKCLGGNTYTQWLLIGLGLLSVTTAALFILVQQDYKRLLAYSSVEHMGILALGLGIMTPLSIFATLYHMINHSITKSMLFLGSGNVFLHYGTRRIEKVKGLLKALPVTGLVFLLGTFAITGMPPFGIFNSELGMVLSAVKSGNMIPGFLLLLFLAFIFIGFMKQIIPMLFAPSPEPSHHIFKESLLSSLTLITLLAMALILGLWIPGPLRHLLLEARDILLGGMMP